jgi:hypothetical protein
MLLIFIAQTGPGLKRLCTSTSSKAFSATLSFDTLRSEENISFGSMSFCVISRIQLSANIHTKIPETNANARSQCFTGEEVAIVD